MHDIIPKLNDTKEWISLTAIMTSFLGMELAAVHGNKIRVNPDKAFPIAMFFSVLIILFTMISSCARHCHSVAAARD